MLNRVSIITPLSRPENYSILRKNIPKEVEWIIVTDGYIDFPIRASNNTKIIIGPKTNTWGDSQRSIGLNFATREYVYFLDDDNLIYPFALKIAIDCIEYFESDAVLFGILSYYPYLEDIWFPSDPIAKGKVDLGMFLGKRELITKIEFGNDGHFPNLSGMRGADYEFLFRFDKSYKIIRLPMILGFHNGIELVKRKSSSKLEAINDNKNLLDLLNSYLKDKNPNYLEKD